MTLAELLERYGADERIQQLAGQLQQSTPTPKLHLAGIVGSADAMLAAAVFKQTSYNHLFIHTDKEDAAYFHNDLSALLEKKDIFFFPDSFKRPGRLEEVDNNNVMLRTEAVNRLTHSDTKGELVVTYPEALFEKVVRKETLTTNTIKMAIGEKLDVDFMIDVLVTYGFERTDFVYEPGQFSVRGGIVDVFSYGNDHPYRIELFGEEVESIRNFDPESQLSQKKISSVTIVPNIQTHFTNRQKTSFFDILPENTVVWIKDAQLTFDRVTGCFEHAQGIYDNLHGNAKPPEDLHQFFEEEPAVTFENAVELSRNLAQFPIIETGSVARLEPQQVFYFNLQPQPAFNKNFELLINDLKKKQKEKIQTLLFSDNPKQFDRFTHIFEDLNADVTFQPVPVAIHRGYIDTDLNIQCYTDHQIFDRYHKYRVKKGFSKSQALMMKTLKELQPGDYVTHIDHGVGVYSGLEKIEVNGRQQEAVRLIYKDKDLLYVNINALHKIAKYTGKEGHAPKVNKLGSDAWEQVKRRTKKKIKDIAEELIKLYAERRSKQGFAFSPDTYMQTELEASFIYEDTPDQEKATLDVKRDMEKAYPMDRLVCGDVGFGKTEIAVRAAFKAVADSKQVAVLVPTTILSMQHYATFRERLEAFPCEVDYINRFKSTAEKKATLKKLEEGKIDIIVGTHALISKKVKFKDLGLLIIDEEQKFGVSAKEKLRRLRVNVDTLTLTATPIPRTLQFSLMGARDLSVINTPPPNRQPIQTELHVFNDDILKEAIEYEVYRGGQVFFVHNRVKDIMDVAGMLKALCPSVDFSIAHGQMDGKKLEQVMLDFIDRKSDVLVSTNIIESGLDISNANTIIINNAHWFGMSDLHQLRGRVGRSNKKAFCYLFTPPLSALPYDTRKRLQTIEEFSELGSGFNIAMRDLDIRGAGNLLGGEQSGFIAEIGYETYQKILDEAISELKQSNYKELYKDELVELEEFVRDVSIETDLEMLIPDTYVTNVNERLSLYTELDNIPGEEGLVAFYGRLHDRFGPVPQPVEELFNAIRLRWTAKKLGFERIIFKNNKLRCFFIENQENYFFQTPVFGQILNYVQIHPDRCNLKQTNKYLILVFEGINTMEQAKAKLQDIADTISVEAEEES